MYDMEKHIDDGDIRSDGKRQRAGAVQSDHTTTQMNRSQKSTRDNPTGPMAYLKIPADQK